MTQQIGLNWSSGTEVMPSRSTGSNHVAMLNLMNVYSWEALTDPNHAIVISVHILFLSLSLLFYSHSF